MIGKDSFRSRRFFDRSLSWIIASKAKQVCNRFIISQNTRSFLCCLLRHRHLLLAMPMPTTRASSKALCHGPARDVEACRAHEFGGENFAAIFERLLDGGVGTPTIILPQLEQASGCGVGKVVLSHCCAKRLGGGLDLLLSQDVNFKDSAQAQGDRSGRD